MDVFSHSMNNKYVFVRECSCRPRLRPRLSSTGTVHDRTKALYQQTSANGSLSYERGTAFTRPLSYSLLHQEMISAHLINHSRVEFRCLSTLRAESPSKQYKQ